MGKKDEEVLYRQDNRPDTSRIWLFAFAMIKF
jgi:hypothetical protein